MQTAEMASKLKDAEPTMVLGPRASASKLLPTIPIIANRISGAEEPEIKQIVFILKLFMNDSFFP